VTSNPDFNVTGVTSDALDVLYAQLTRDLFAIAKFLIMFVPCGGLSWLHVSF